MNGTFLGIGVHIFSTLISIVCYQKSRNFVILQNLIMLMLKTFGSRYRHLWIDALISEQQISFDNYKILRCDRNRPRWGVACYVRNDLRYLSVFLLETENILFEFLIPNSKAITVGNYLWSSPIQSNFLEVLKIWIKLIQYINEIYWNLHSW